MNRKTSMIHMIQILLDEEDLNKAKDILTITRELQQFSLQGVGLSEGCF